MSLGGAGVGWGRRRRRPAGEPPPLPHRIGMTGWWWLGLGTVAILLWAVAVTRGGGGLLGVDQQVLEGLALLRSPTLTKVMLVVAELGSPWVIVGLGWATIVVLLAV